MTRTWSEYQTAIFNFIETPDAGNLIVEAVAGSGKTTTIVEGTKRCGEDAAVIFLAFNKAIAEELKARGVNAKTFHSLCYSPVTRAKGVRAANTNKLWQLQDDLFTETEAKLYGAFARKLVGLAKQVGIGCLVADTEDAWQDIIDHHEIELDHDEADPYVALALTRKLFEASIKSPEVDFDDMLYFAVKDGISLPRFDWVFVDEAQDTNAIQRAILRKIMRPGSRLVAVGDPAQAIYGFRGADSDSLGLIASDFDCKTLPLSVSYRCAQSVVEYARNWVSHILPAPTAPVGEVKTLGEWGPRIFERTDMVVCRTTKPLVALGYKMIKERVPVRILGKEIGDGLIKLIEKQKAKGIEKLCEKLYAYQNREMEKARAAKKEGKASAIADKVEAIMCLIEGMDETNRTIPALIDIIQQLFADQKNCTTLCTIHKSKGLEADRVYWLNRSACPSKWARQEWQMQQEANLCYVAVTRAKTELCIIEDDRLSDNWRAAPVAEAAT